MEKVEEMDEVVMAEIQKSQGEYKPLAKVEELEEANYNMIDNVLNNMPPKKEPYVLPCDLQIITLEFLLQSIERNCIHIFSIDDRSPQRW